MLFQCAQCFASKVIGVDVFDAMVHCVQLWCSFKLVYRIVLCICCILQICKYILHICIAYIYI